MGAWGTGILQDDVAADVVQDYRDLLSEGKTGPQATQQMLGRFRDEIRDRDDGPVFWLALAAIQWKLGRLEDKVKTRALKLIDSGRALKSWTERSDGVGIQSRQRALASLREQLQSPQPAARRIRQQAAGSIDTLTWPVGSLLKYRLHSGKFVVLMVVDVQGNARNGYMTIFALLDWIGKKIPSAEKLKRLPIFQRENYLYRIAPFLIAVGGHGSQEPARLESIDVLRPPKKEKTLAPLFRSDHIDGGYGFAFWETPVGKKSHWPQLDDALMKEMGCN